MQQDVEPRPETDPPIYSRASGGGQAARGDVRRRRRNGDRGLRPNVRRSGQLAQFREYVGGAVLVDGGAAVGRIQHSLDLVAGPQGEIDQVGSGLELSIAQPVECRFEIVRKGRDVVEAEHGTRSLNRVQSPESPPDHLAVVAPLIQLQQRRFQFREQLARFFLKRLLILVDHPSTLFTTARSCWVANGFTIQPVAPAALPSCLRESWDSVVSMMMGIPLHAGLARSFRMRPMPSRFGMLRSVITRFTGLVSLVRASWPSTASITV